MSDVLKQQIEDSIEQSNKLLEAFAQFEKDNSDDNFAAVTELSQKRSQSLHQLFSQHQQTELAQYSQLLSTIAQLDQQLLSTATQQKSLMAKKVIQQKKNTKATNAYLNK